MTDQSDDRMTILNAIITNTRVKICFGGLAPDDADFMARVLFSGFLDLQEWKDLSARPTAIGNKKEIVRSRSRAEHEAEHEMHAHSSSRGHGEATGTMTSSNMSTGHFAASGDSAGSVMQAPAQLFGPNQPGAQMLPVPLTQSEGASNSRGSSEMSGSSSGASHVSMESYSESEMHGQGRSRGTSITEGESETFVTDYADLATQMYSLQEQQFKAVGDLINQPPRHCYLKIGNDRPVRTRTLDVQPAFRSHFAKRVMLPIFHSRMLALSPYLRPAQEVDALIAARMTMLQPPSMPEPSFGPEPMPDITAVPEQFAAKFWSKRRLPSTGDDPPKPKPKPKKPKGRRPIGDLGPKHHAFTVIDGDKDK